MMLNDAADDSVLGGYRLVRSLGRGGFGEVFLGEAEDGTRAAVKVLHASWAGDADMRRRFAAEVEQARRVSGFCVAAILDADPEGERPWIATEYIDGPTLQRAVAEEGPRRGVELQRLAVNTATALAAVHAAGVVHRDLKPDNIMLAPDGPRVIDFGIARAVETTSVTASGVVGTIGYMAPEQLEGARLTSAVDVFSWGAVMVYAATGQEAFQAPTQASRIARILGGTPDLGDLPEPLRGIVHRCLDKDPERRPDASALLTLLIAGPNGVTAAGPGASAAPTLVAPVVDPTRVAPAPVVDPTRVAPHHGVDPTRSYTRVAPSRALPAAPSPAPHTGPGTPVPVPPSYAGPGAVGGSARHTGIGGVPPYHFVGIRFTDPGALAEAMQANWGAAVRVFGDATERAALGAWLMNDLGDTIVDRALFRRHADDANLALASFIAQLRPDLPPAFRGLGATLPELAELFSDPRPVITGAPMSNEMALLARPAVLRLMGLHHGADPGAYQRLADSLDTAEHAGNAFHQELTGGLAGWRAAVPNVNPALILTFLLHPERMTPPSNGGDNGVGEWIDILWRRVDASPGPVGVGHAAAIYGALATLQALARQRRYWEERYTEVSTEHETLHAKVEQQQRFFRIRRYCNHALFCLPIGLVLDLSGRAEVLGGLLISVAVLAFCVSVVLSMVLRVGYGDPVRRGQRVMELNNAAARLPELTSGVERIRADLLHARRLTGG
ncbi:serine/threonine-protein kinase [Nocardiopsis sp. N85]|uniref:serine/threonine-protein kinase n=1 Tax=Nocardiopsis sp. N85 TaxID=3029400 RepID=UPI00237F371C|nr:serine/threonine-protein kinase [Nocardiopsis sp. N85]MDE3723858.1 serine/threonine-protein kinase [Nocardiopsis sp. N85]